MNHVQPIAAPDADLRLFTGVFSETESERLFAELREAIAWRQDSITIGGRPVLTPRLTAWYGDPGAVYRYSGVTLVPMVWIDPLSEIRKRVEAVTEAGYNSVLANLYRDGRDSVGWHSDDEPELGGPIASVSFGAVRRFVLRHKKRKDAPEIELWLPAGSVLLMQGPTQCYWRHRLPKTARPVGPRINLTFRTILEPSPGR